MNFIERKSRVIRADWQLNAELPNTEEGALHTGIDFGCYKCGALIVKGVDIFLLKNNAIWTNKINDSLNHSIIKGEKYWNKYKKVNLIDAKCRNCDYKVGSIYEEPFVDQETKKKAYLPFPCAKINYRWKNKYDEIRNDTILIGDKHEVMSAISKVANEFKENKKSEPFLSGCAVNSETFDSHKRVKDCEEENRKLKEKLTLQTIWECCVDSANDVWEEYSKEFSDLLEENFQKRENVQFEINEFPYVVDLKDPENLFQREIRGNFTKYRIRRTEIPLDIPRNIDWCDTTEKRRISDNTIYPSVYKYSIPAGKDCSHSRETAEFNHAAAQFCRMLQVPITVIKKIDFCDNIHLKKVFDKKKISLTNELKDSEKMEEIWVFHGTSDDERVDSILLNGFKVGGKDGVRAKNGNKHGFGVYTAKGPQTPMRYAQGCGKVILSRALCGRKGKDSREPEQDWVIFRSGDQLLPTYVVHYNMVLK